jgi:hypothetical protein
MSITELLQRQLECLAELDPAAMADVLEPRAQGGLNDVMLAYCSWLMRESDSETAEFLSPIDRLCIALDIALRNRGVPLESRRVIVARLRELCRQEPELLQLMDKPGGTEEVS